MSNYEKKKKQIDMFTKQANFHYKRALVLRDSVVRLQAELGNMTIAQAEATVAPDAVEEVKHEANQPD